MKTQIAVLVLALVSSSAFASTSSLTANCTVMATRASDMDSRSLPHHKFQVVLTPSPQNGDYYAGRFKETLTPKSFAIGDVGLNVESSAKNMTVRLKLIQIVRNHQVVKGMADGASTPGVFVDSARVTASAQAMNLDTETIDLNHSGGSRQNAERYLKSGVDLVEATLLCDLVQ